MATSSAAGLYGCGTGDFYFTGQRDILAGMRYIQVLAGLLPVLSFAEVELPPPADLKVDFARDVQPLFAAKCFGCHGSKQQQSGLRLDKRQQALRGGDYGPVIVQGKSAESKLILKLVNGDGGLQMPPTGALEKGEIGMLRLDRSGRRLWHGGDQGRGAEAS